MFRRAFIQVALTSLIFGACGSGGGINTAAPTGSGPSVPPSSTATATAMVTPIAVTPTPSPSVVRMPGLGTIRGSISSGRILFGIEKNGAGTVALAYVDPTALIRSRAGSNRRWRRRSGSRPLGRWSSRANVTGFDTCSDSMSRMVP